MVKEVFADVPKSWYQIIGEMVDEIQKLELDNNLEMGTIEIYEMKEKYNTLRIFAGIPVLLEDDLTDEYANLLNNVIIQLDEITDKYEKLVKDKVRKGEL